ASKSQKSAEQREKERKRKEHAAKILGKHKPGGKKQKTSASPAKSDVSTTSAFQTLFKARARGFEIDFKFRNAPPRPPVGPCFFGSDLDEKLQELSQYKPLNSVEANYRWHLHTEPDLGVSFAPSAMDPNSYQYVETSCPPLDKADSDLLEWKGSMGDSVAETLKQSRDNARAVARMTAMGKSPAKPLSKSPLSTSKSLDDSSRKTYSRVLNEAMQSWMKKTTYISNDHSRKVHDFKSLAKTKADLEEDLVGRQQDLMQKRSAPAVAATFTEVKHPVKKHPSKKNLTPVAEMEFLPDVDHWGKSYTHVVFDKSPGEEDAAKLDKAIVANVQQKDATARMTGEVFAPADVQDANTNGDQYTAIQQYELDVVPLKEEDIPHDNFCIWVDPDSGKASYIPVSSRVMMSTGRPLHKQKFNMKVTRRAMTDEDKADMDQRLAEVDADIDQKLNGGGLSSKMASSLAGADDDDSDDSDDEPSFMPTSKTVAAES
ncbi:MAG: hypothetical protein SGILL_007092, partial [Bacillariaceae sp.]